MPRASKSDVLSRPLCDLGCVRVGPTNIITPGRICGSLFPISNQNEAHPHHSKVHTQKQWPEEIVTPHVDSVEIFRMMK